MAFKLILRTEPEVAETQRREWEFNEGKVLIGRGNGCQLQLDDPRKVVSSHHVVIQQEDNQYFLMDTGSLNGTLLNGVRLEPKQKYHLPFNATIGLSPEGEHQQCAFYFIFQVRPSPERGAEESTGGETLPLDMGLRKYVELVEQIRESYWEWVDLSSTERQEQICEFIRQQIRKNKIEDVAEFLGLIEQSFPCTGGVQIENTDKEKKAISKKRKGESGGFQNLQNTKELLQTFSHFSFEALNHTTLEQLDKRLAQCLKLFLDFLAQRLIQRRQFQQELGIQVTEILAGGTNPVKWAQNSQEIGEYLFGIGDKQHTTEKVVSNVREALQYLTLHQMGVMEGFRDCVEAVLGELSPRKIEAIVNDHSVLRSNIMPFNWILAVSSWREYQKRHHNLTNEKHHLVNEIFRPYLEKGYLRVHATNSDTV